MRVTSVDGQWLTCRDLAVRLGVSVDAARRRALRGKWARMPRNDGMTRVRPLTMCQTAAPLTSGLTPSLIIPAAFAALPERPDALAAQRARPWWRRLMPRQGAGLGIAVPFSVIDWSVCGYGKRAMIESILRFPAASFLMNSPRNRTAFGLTGSVTDPMESSETAFAFAQSSRAPKKMSSG